MNSLSFISDGVYALKTRYGIPVDVYRTTTVTDLRTGIKTTTYTKTSVPRAIVDAGKSARLFVQRDLNMGALFDVNDRDVIVDMADLGDKPTINDYVVIRNQRYDIKNVVEYETQNAYLLVLRQTKAQKQVLVFDQVSVMVLDQGVIHA